MKTGHLWNQLILVTVWHRQEWTWLVCLVSLLEVYMKNIFYLKSYVSELCLALFLLGKSPVIH